MQNPIFVLGIILPAWPSHITILWEGEIFRLRRFIGYGYREASCERS
jgi:hypothetical protein